MAKKTQVRLDVKADDKGSLKKVGLNAKKAGNDMEHLSNASNNARRNMGGAANMSNRGAKNFSKMQQGVGGLVGVYADLAARVFAVSAAFQFLKSASDVANLIAGQEALGAVTGVAYKTITASIKDATGGQIAYADAAKAAAIGTAAGLSPSQLNRLGAAAKNVSNALGRDLTDSFNRLVRGITKAEPELLDELGIILRLDDAAKKYADRLGLVADDLTTFQRSQAVANETLSQVEEKFGAIAEIMDPSAASLNRFLVSFDTLMNSIKTGSMTLLRPVFDFLAGNTTALTAALAAIAIPIVRTILPNFDKMAKAMDKSVRKQGKSLKRHIGKINETKAALEAMNVTKTDIGKSTAGVFSKLGASTTGKVGGGAGADFLLGTSDSKAAQSNAKKILDNAKEQLKNHHIVTKGYLIGATDKELQILEAGYKRRKALLKNYELEHKNAYARMAGYTKIAVSGVAATAVGIGAFVTGALTVLGKAIMGLFSIAFWASIVAAGVQAFAAWKDAANPISEQSKKNAAAIKKFEKASKTLNEELEGMANAQPYQGVTEQVIGLGNALTSADLLPRIEELKNLMFEPPPEKTWLTSIWHDFLGILPEWLEETENANEVLKYLKDDIASQKGGDPVMHGLMTGLAFTATPFFSLVDWVSTSLGEAKREAEKPHWKNMFDGVRHSLESLAEMDPAFKPFLEEFNIYEFLDDDWTARLNETVEKFKNWGVVLKGTAAQVKEMDDELKDMVGTGLIMDPTRNIRRYAQTVIDSTTTNLESLPRQKREMKKRASNSASVLIKRQLEFADLFPKSEQAKPGFKENLSEADRKQYNERSAVIADLKKENESAVKNAEQASTQIEKQTDQRERARSILEAMNKVHGNITGKLQEQNALSKRAATLQTLGITKEQKLSNLKAKGLEQDAKKLGLEVKVAQATAVQEAARKNIKESDPNTQMLADDAQNALDLAENELEVFNILNVLFRDRLKMQREQVILSDEQLDITRRQKIFEHDIAMIQIRRKASERLSPEGKGRSSQELASMKRTNTLLSLNEKIAIIKRNQVENARKYDVEERKKENADKGILFGLKQNEESLERQLATTYDLINAQIQLEAVTTQGLKDRAADVAGQIGGLSISKRATFINEQMRNLPSDATDEEKAAHKVAAEELYNLNIQLENTQSLYDTIDSSMQSAFEGMITGAMSAKEAFATMAQNILKELARIIAQQMVLKALQTASGFGLSIPGMKDGGVTPKLTGSRYTVGGIARGPSSGYPAILHGNEAVVPLPSGGAIPVQGNIGSGTNNVTVNVTVDSDGNAKNDASGEGQGQDLGKVVARAVQEELQYQKRSGGILNPYGAA